MQLEHGLAGVGRRGREQQREALIERLAVRAEKSGDRRHPRRKRAADDAGNDASEIGAGDAHHADAAPAGRRGDRGDDLGRRRH